LCVAGALFQSPAQASSWHEVMMGKRNGESPRPAGEYSGRGDRAMTIGGARSASTRAPASNALGERRRDRDREGDDPRIATTLARGLRVLGAFRSNDDGPLGNKEIAARTGLAKATVSRLTYTLTALGYLAQEPRSGGYQLAAGVLSFAHVFLAGLDVRTTARPLMQTVAAPPGATVVLATRDRLMMTTIEAVVADSRFQLRAWIGASAPIARTASGHAYLAGLADGKREALLAELRRQQPKEWPAIAKSIERSVRSVESKGYCVALGEWKTHVNDVAVPLILDETRENVLTLACGGPPALLTPKKLDELGRQMMDVGSEIERLFGKRA